MEWSASYFVVGLLSIVMSVTGCALAPEREYIPGISSDVRDGAAIVIGQGPGASSIAKALLGEFTNDKGADLLSVNRRYIKVSATSKLVREYWLKPGKYGLAVECYIRQAGAESLRNVELEQMLEPSHVYKLEVGYTQIRGGMSPEIECNTSIRDVTSGVNTKG
jgi:hypothetical protein